LKHDQYWCQWLVWCEKHDVIIDKQIWHGIVKKAMDEVNKKRIRRLLKGLLNLDDVPRTSKAFKAFVGTELAGVDTNDDTEALWAAIKKAKQIGAETSAAKAQFRRKTPSMTNPSDPRPDTKKQKVGQDMTGIVDEEPVSENPSDPCPDTKKKKSKRL